MRADRLVATLLLLQSRGRVTAAEVAEELEVSERTARRDLDALSMAGIPVYSQPGRGGGWELLGGARTDLSGLTSSEARALFLVAGPSSSATPEVKAALRKLVQALPEPFRDHAEAASAAVVVDPSSWGTPGGAAAATPRHLEALQAAVVDGVQVRLGYAGRDKDPSLRVVHPLGLVAKGRVWYLVAGTNAGQRTFRVSRVQSVDRLEDPVDRPEGFDLAEAWQAIATEVDERRAPFKAPVRADADMVDVLRMVFGTRCTVGQPLPDGRVALEVGASSPYMLANEIAGFGARVEVDDPDVRRRLAEIGAELQAAYAGG